MAIHWVRFITAGHLSTQRLFELGSSFSLCKRARRWPSLETMNDFLKKGADDGTTDEDIEWEPCEISREDYEKALVAFMAGESYVIDTELVPWDIWFSRIDRQGVA